MSSIASFVRPFTRSTQRTRSLRIATASRQFHSPFAVLGDSPLTVPPSPTSTVSALYEKQSDHSNEPIMTHSGTRTYVVSEPDASAKHYEVPSGAYPTSAPYVNFTPTEAPDTKGAQYSSTSSGVLAHQFTTRAAPQNSAGVGESSAVRYRSAPGEMGARGGGYGGQNLADPAGTTPGEGQLADRNPPPDGAAAEKFSKAGVDNAWKLRR